VKGTRFFWTRAMVDVLDAHYEDVGASETRDILAQAGWSLTATQVASKARQLGLRGPQQARSLLGQAPGGYQASIPTGGWFARPPRVTAALAELAETPGLTLAEYESAKARILEGE